MYRFSSVLAFALTTACATGPIEPAGGAQHGFLAEQTRAATVATRGAGAARTAGGQSAETLPEAAEAGAERAVAPPEAAEVAVEAVDIASLDTGLVCSTRTRPGSRVTEKYCYTRDDPVAEAARDERVRAQMEQMTREQIERENWERMERERRAAGMQGIR